MEDIYGNKSRRSSPDVVGHEFAHIIQRLAQPVQIANTLGDLDDIALRDELEAYNIQQDIILQMIQDDYAHRNEPLTYTKEWHGVSSFVFTINNLRNHYNKNREDKFFPDTGIRDTLHGLGIKVQASFVDDSIRHQEIF